MKKKMISIGMYFLLFLLFAKCAQAGRLAYEATGNIFLAIARFGDFLKSVFGDAFFQIRLTDFCAGGVIFSCFCLRVYLRSNHRNDKNPFQGNEYGSARWGTAKDIQPYIDPVFDNNILLTATERITMSSRPKNPKYARNKNVLVVGGSGSGKTRFYVKPNLLQLHSSYIITDPKGTLAEECGKLFENHGYRLKIFNTVDFKKSMHYNAFAYIHSEKDILKLVTVLMANTSDPNKTGNDPFWEKTEQILYMALIGYIHYELPVEEQNFASLLEMLNIMRAEEDDENSDVPGENGVVHWCSHPVDILFDELREKKPNCFAVRQYAKFKMAAGKTAKSILVSCGARLAVFDIQEILDITSYDELELDTLGGTKEDPMTKTALFLIMSDTDKTFNFLLAMIYSQMFNLLCEKADNEFGGRLPIHVRCLCDEFANCGKIPDFEKLIATIRSREISASVILQTESQLKTIYRDAADTIIGNMDTYLFLGGKEAGTLRSLSESLGKMTIHSKTHNRSRGKESSVSENENLGGRDLMMRNELETMDRGKCILQISGVPPFLSEKYDITKHPRYGELSDSNSKNRFNVEEYLKHDLKLKKQDQFSVYTVTKLHNQ